MLILLALTILAFLMYLHSYIGAATSMTMIIVPKTPLLLLGIVVIGFVIYLAYQYWEWKRRKRNFNFIDHR